MNKCNYNSGSNYAREGQWIIAKYLNMCFVTGIVQESRVKYGGAVQHTIISDSPAVMRIGEQTYEIREIGTTFLIEEKDIEYCEFATEPVL